MADGFVAKEVAFENTAGANMNQSVAMAIQGKYSAFYKCRFSGYQDTLYVKHGIQFFRECRIYGTVDFIFGDASALFQNCSVYARKPRQGQSNTITAQKRESEGYVLGIVLQNCTIDVAPDLLPKLNVSTYLGRPWRNYATTVITQSYLGHSLDKLYYAEYANQGPGENTSHRVGWAHRNISYTDAKKFTARAFLNGSEWISSTGIPCNLDL
ncbi:probable pectinesterase/pectinesterase inhibitor 39 [Henckelia pumila]|uniref:probable pectinesterase/pectinesterase inhibitor 39 n=1 Tax=Henckelia pumila TaxID=405737 RepID=UPI003C6DF8BD